MAHTATLLTRPDQSAQEQFSACACAVLHLCMIPQVVNVSAVALSKQVVQNRWCNSFERGGGQETLASCQAPSQRGWEQRMAHISRCVRCR